jgi:STE24 endopeptidase
MVSRTFEFQADSFAISQGLGADLRMALLKLEEENKSAMNVDPLYSSYHYSHPPLAERLKAIDSGLKKAL